MTMDSHTNTSVFRSPIAAAAGLVMAIMAWPAAAQPSLESVADNLRPRYSTAGTMPRYRLEDRMAHYGVPGVAVAVLKDGKVLHAGGFGVLQAGGDTPVDGDTLFSAGSVSKMATATLLLKMQAEGRLDVNSDVRRYLKNWQMPESDRPVTLRMILSHTAGFNIHGFADFQPGAALPTVYDTLNGTAPASHDALRFVDVPGSRYRYSGGGYTLAQLVATDMSGQSFTALADEVLFSPLGMRRSSFANPLPEATGNIAKAHDRQGRPTALPRGYEAMPEMAASGLWTSANDLGRMVAALIESYRGQDGYLPQAIAADMMTKVSPSEHGLGPRLKGTGLERLFHHGGANNSYRAWMEGHLATGDGLVVLTNGTRGHQLYVEIRNAVADVYGWQSNQPLEIVSVPVQADMLSGFVGGYHPHGNYPLAHREAMIGWIYDRALNVSMDGGRLYAGIEGRDRRYELIPTAPNRFILSGLDQRIGVAELMFHRGVDAGTQAVTLHIGGASSFYQRNSMAESAR